MKRVYELDVYQLAEELSDLEIGNLKLEIGERSKGAEKMNIEHPTSNIEF